MWFDEINKRTSVRKYTDVEFDESENNLIKEIIEKPAISPFDNPFQIKWVSHDVLKEQGIKRIGTYGFITGKPSYIFGVVKGSERSFINYGYVMERFVLELTKAGFDSCWLGASFSRKLLYDKFELNEQDTIPAVIAFGHNKQGKSNFIQTYVIGNNAHKRVAFDKLFFYEELQKPLTKEMLSLWEHPLEAVRLAPSAMNKQPWRAIVDEKGVHFYLKPVKSFNFQYIDMGIGLLHFDLVREEKGIFGTWKQVDKNINGLKYITSFILI